MKARLTGMAALTCLVGVMVAGCGGDESSDAESNGDAPAVQPVKTSQLDKQAFLKKLNDECRKVRKDLMTKAGAYLGKQEGVSEDVANAKLGKAVVVPTVEEEMAVIRELGAPAGDEDEIEAILSAQQRGIDEVRGLKQTESIQDILDRFAAPSKALQRYGLTACGN